MVGDLQGKGVRVEGITGGRKETFGPQPQLGTNGGRLSPEHRGSYLLSFSVRVFVVSSFRKSCPHLPPPRLLLLCVCVCLDTNFILHEMTTAVMTRQVLLQGEAFSGKTALMAHTAVESGFPFVRKIAADELIGMGDVRKLILNSRVLVYLQQQ